MPFTAAYQAMFLKYIYSGVAMTLPTGFSVSLHVGGSAPNIPAGSGIVEPSGGNYARKSVTRDQTATGWTAATSGVPSVKFNFSQLVFNKASADWGTVTHFALHDFTTGVPFYIGAVTPIIITNGDTAIIAQNDSIFTIH